MVLASLFLKISALLPLPVLILSPVLGRSWAFVALFYFSILHSLQTSRCSLMAILAHTRGFGCVHRRLGSGYFGAFPSDPAADCRVINFSRRSGLD